MSYDLGCFAECLECELCESGIPNGDDDEGPEPEPPDLDPPSDFYDRDHDGDGVPDWADPDWGPDPDEDD